MKTDKEKIMELEKAVASLREQLKAAQSKNNALEQELALRSHEEN